MRPTLIKLASERCPQAVRFYREGAHYDRKIFQQGIAAHAYLQSVPALKDRSDEGLKKLAGQVVTELVSKGRSFEGNPEPPMDPEAASAGVALALDYAIAHEIPRANPGLHVERGLAVNSSWESTKYGPDAWYRCIPDLVEEAWDGSYTVADITDYKSSWVAGSDWLHSIQAKSQACMVAAHSDVKKIRLWVINLRTQRRYPHPDDPFEVDRDGDEIKRWKDEISAVVEGLYARKDAPAEPGSHCGECWFARTCPDFKKWAKEAPDPVSVWLSAKALVKAVTPLVKGAVAGGEVVASSGETVGYRKTSKRHVIDPLAVLEDWGSDNPRGFLQAAGLSVTQLDRLAKSMYETKEEQDQWVAENVEVTGGKELGVL